MVIFRLKEKASINLEGIQVLTAHRIGRETKKAVLLEVIHSVDGMDAKKIGYWLPKSQIKYDSEKIEIPNWLWDAKKSAMDYVEVEP
jgi:hypothetical protein